jgi:hypothetical protein
MSSQWLHYISARWGDVGHGAVLYFLMGVPVRQVDSSAFPRLVKDETPPPPGPVTINIHFDNEDEAAREIIALLERYRRRHGGGLT